MTNVRVLAWDATGSRRLEHNGSVPVIEIAGGALGEDAETIVGAVRSELGLEVALNRVVDKGLVEVECRGPDADPSSGLRWRRRIPPPASLRPAWHRRGWLSATLAAVDRELTGRGYTRTGAPVQTRHTVVTAMLRIPTDLGEVWLKAILPIFAREARVVRWLAGLDAAVPVVLGEGASWWLSVPFPAEVPGSRGSVLSAIARLQMGAVSRVAELRALGCPDRSLPRLVADVTRLAERDDLLGIQDRKALGSVLRRFEVLCKEVDALGLPVTLVHGDLHIGNARWTADGWFLFDWTDACLAHPLADLAYVLDEHQSGWSDGVDEYVESWTRMVPRLDVGRALAVAPAIAAGHQAASYEWIADAVDRSEGSPSEGEELLQLLRFWVRRLVALL